MSASAATCCSCSTCCSIRSRRWCRSTWRSRDDTVGAARKAYCERALHHLLEPKTGIDGALLASPDGFEIASAIRGRTLPRAQVAAMSSSLFAVGAAMAHELRLGACRNVVVEAATGTLLLFTVPCKRAPLVLRSIATSDATLGMALISTRTCARDVARQLDVGHRALEESRVRVP